MPNYRPARARRYNYLIKAGFTIKEAAELSRQYSMEQMRSLPYLTRMIRTRRLYGTSLAAKGYGWDEIKRSIGGLYRKKDWLSSDGSADVWAMLKSFRKQSIQDNEYIPIKRKHHGDGISKGDVRAQKTRRRGRIVLQRGEQGRLQDLIRQRDEAREQGDNFTAFRLQDEIDELRRQNTRFD